MKVLYIGYYKEKSDWGKQTVNNILALESAGVDVVCRSVNLGGTETPDSIRHLEDKETVDVTHCIQHVFPEHMIGTDKFKKNIGLVSNNFVQMAHGGWVEKLTLMDEVWSPFKLSGDRMPFDVKHIPLAIDVDVYNRRYNDLSIKEVENDFKVYTFASSDDIAGLSWILAAFHSEFDPADPVSLVIYLKPNTADGNKELQIVEDLSRNIKGLLRLNSSPELFKKDVIIASQEISDTNVLELHQYCDCYVTSNTEFNFPAAEIDAAGFGNAPIFSDHGAICDYLGKRQSVPSIYQVVQTKGSMFADTNNGHDYWIRPDEFHLKTKMRNAYNEWKVNPMQYKLTNKRAAIGLLSNFSIETVGQQMKEALNA